MAPGTIDDKNKIHVPHSLATLDIRLDFQSDPLSTSSPTAISTSKISSTQQQGIRRHGSKQKKKHTLPPATRKSILSHLRYPPTNNNNNNNNNNTTSHAAATTRPTPSPSPSTTTILNGVLTETLREHCTGVQQRKTNDPSPRSPPSPSGVDYPARIHALCLELLRNGIVEPDFGSVMTEVLRRALGHIDTVDAVDDAAAAAAAVVDTASTSTSASSDSAPRREGNDQDPKERSFGPDKKNQMVYTPTILLPSNSYGVDGLPDVKIPYVVMETGLSVVEGAVRDWIDVDVDNEAG